MKNFILGLALIFTGLLSAQSLDVELTGYTWNIEDEAQLSASVDVINKGFILAPKVGVLAETDFNDFYFTSGLKVGFEVVEGFDFVVDGDYIFSETKTVGSAVFDDDTYLVTPKLSLDFGKDFTFSGGYTFRNDLNESFNLDNGTISLGLALKF